MCIYHFCVCFEIYASLNICCVAMAFYKIYKKFRGPQHYLFANLYRPRQCKLIPPLGWLVIYCLLILRMALRFPNERVGFIMPEMLACERSLSERRNLLGRNCDFFHSCYSYTTVHRNYIGTWLNRYETDSPLCVLRMASAKIIDTSIH